MMDLTKKSCKFIVTTTYNNIIYGRECGNIITNMNNETNEELCKEHYDKQHNSPGKEKKYYDQLASNVCKHIITQKSRGIDRKGMICGKFTFDSKNSSLLGDNVKYCKQHEKCHPLVEVNDDELTLRSFKVRYYPTKEETKKLNMYFGCCRKIYNLCVENKENDKFNNLRDKYVTDMSKKEEYKYMKKVPKEIRSFAVKEYITGLQTNNKYYESLINREKLKEKNKRKEIKKPEIKFRKKKRNQSITIPKSSISIEKEQIYIYKESFNKNPLKLINRGYKKDKKLKELLKGQINHDIKIIKTCLNKYYLCIPIDVKINTQKINENNVVACDPGGRTFMTTYSNYEVLEIGKGINKQIYEDHEKIDKLVKKRKYIIKNNINGKKKEIKQKIIKANTHLINRIDNLHYLTIKKLMNYDRIYIPKLNMKSIMEKNQLTGKTKRQIQKLSHCLFLKRLKNTAEVQGKKVIICSEHLTTKICGNCFTKNEIGGNKEYKCKECGIILDRDINSARNILIRQISSL